ncbi:PTS fructose transporter subunit IIC [Paramaledivibacter caminithermalis]|uniref:PTS system IIC component, Fru family n=1 Tax=Paramaledivibacter caminithermalis (strain DSM 15212 / CIP 107654 / DViRD3) TaxID=1121301 RepID=A0A1M6K9T8_PARC5|nr:fructose-specific PTS transporter subunit EIIC [Paramaledivibacter caminithermalis]SHJ55706.1 PTS system IIC component, Fru family [Paramaledivibacter caminithermalis DSM 15212]
MKDEVKNLRSYLMTGVSYMIPIVVIGGVLIALSIALSGVEAGTGANVTNPFLQKMLNVGVKAFGLMVPVLAGFIAFGIADRPGIAPGLVGGALANEIGAGFLGGIIAGFVAGYTARWVKSWNVPKQIRPIMPIFVIPLVTTGIVGIIMYIIGTPISGFMNFMTEGLKSMSTGNAVFLAIVMGAMIAFDMGGPMNKVAFMFAAAMIGEGVYTVMGPVAVAICIPPLAMGTAALLKPKKYTEAEKEAGKGAIAMGLIGITEGAIPFAAADPVRVIPSIMVGSAVGAAVAAIGKVGDHAPHGGPIVLPVVDNKIMFIIAVLVGMAVTVIMVNTLKKEVKEEKYEKESDEVSIDFN